MWQGWSILAIAAVTIIAIQEAQAANTSNNSVEAEAVTVTGEATETLTSDSAEESAKQEKTIPGAFTVKTTMIWNAEERQTSRICCNESQAFSFNQKTASKFPKFQFEALESLLKRSHSV